MITARTIAVVLLALSFALPAGALIFSQRGERYDHDQNNIEMEEAWRKGHAVGFMHGFTGVAVAPYWFVTASHLANTKPRVFDCPVGSFRILEFVPLVGETILARVDEPFRQYSRLLARPLQTNDLLTMYGRSSSHYAGSPFRGAGGAVQGWIAGSAKQESMRLRWGLARVDHASEWIFNWPFTSNDPEIGANCVAVCHMDSGGGVFLGGDFAGLLVTGTYTRRARPSLEQRGRDCKPVFLFDASGLYHCENDSAFPSNRVSLTSAMPLAPNLDRIYSVIAPPQRINAGTAEIDGWTAWSASYNVVTFPFPAAETNGLTAPPQVYRAAVYVQGTNMLTYPATNLLMTERYTLRLHFGPIPFLDPGEVQQDVYINGINRASRFDPVRQSGPDRKPVVLEIRGIEPEAGSRASITLLGVGPKPLAYLSGLELLLERR